MRTAAFSSCASWRLAAAAAALAAYAGLAGARGWIRDDLWLIAENPLMQRGWAGAPALLKTGYVEAVMGASAPIQEYRPLLSLTFLAQLAAFGKRPGPMRAANVALHAAVCLLLFEALRRRMALRAAGAAAVIFAVLPIHAEAVSYITSRSELLVAASTLGCWLLLSGKPGPGRLAAGLAVFGCGLLSKEHSVLIPAFLALSDWTFDGAHPWSRPRRPVYLGLFCVAAGYAALRWAVLGPGFHGGSAYFTGPRLSTALTMARFGARHYAWPALSGVGQCADFTRPMILDEPARSPAGWLCLSAAGGILAAAARAAWRRRSWGFWVLGPALFLLPTCNLLLPLDTIGAERFLYLPTIGLAAGMGALFERGHSWSRPISAVALSGVLAWYTAASWRRNGAWLSPRAYFAAARDCNPLSARAHAGLGASLLMEGQQQAGQEILELAARLDPRLADAPYNLAQLAWRRGDAAEARRQALRCLSLDPGASDAWVLLGLTEEALGRRPAAKAAHQRALAIMPWNALAHFNLGRLQTLDGLPALAAPHWRQFVSLAPKDPDARRVSELIGRSP